MREFHPSHPFRADTCLRRCCHPLENANYTVHRTPINDPLPPLPAGEWNGTLVCPTPRGLAVLFTHHRSATLLFTNGKLTPHIVSFNSNRGSEEHQSNSSSRPEDLRKRLATMHRAHPPRSGSRSEHKLMGQEDWQASRSQSRTRFRSSVSRRGSKNPERTQHRNTPGRIRSYKEERNQAQAPEMQALWDRGQGAGAETARVPEQELEMGERSQHFGAAAQRP